MGFLFLAGVAFLVAVALLAASPFKEHQRRQLARAPFPPEWRQILRHRVPLVGRLPADLQLRLKRQIQIFVAEKTIVGCDGLIVTDEMRVVVAAQACLLTLGRPDYHFPGVSQILLYPSAFIISREQQGDAGLQTTNSSVLLGESWTHGQVILSWPDALQGATVCDDGQNLVIHEFAHQIDQEKGYANGAPGLLNRHRLRRWARVLGDEFAALQASVLVHQESLFDPYGASNPAEFFAVISEVFFEQPQQMSNRHPALFHELRRFYRLNPLTW